MTAEVAVINKSAVALASDSAVTVELTDSRGRSSDKIYNTANKLFALSKVYPVGIMVYNTMELGGVPWETIIKEYRRQLSDKKFDHLADYADDFFNFLQGNNFLFPSSRLDDVLARILIRYFFSILEDFEITSNQQARTVFDKEIRRLEKINFADSFNYDDANWVKSKYKIIDYAASVIFKPSYLKNLKTKYRELASLAVTKNEQLRAYSGVVITGFGEKDSFPFLVEYQLDLIINRKVRKSKIQDYEPSISKAGKVLSFAQKDITQTILEGINPSYKNFIHQQVIDFLIELPRTVIDGINELTDAQKVQYKNDALDPTIRSVSNFIGMMEDERMNKHTFQIERSIEMMPFSELAEVAELFIGLTQMRRRLSPDSETVGGPIDVAVISKADGFVWVKRKFYFDKELNYSFFDQHSV